MKWYQKLGLKYPLFQGGMAWASTPKLVAAVSNVGGLGIIGSGGRTADELRKLILQTRKLTSKPFGVNLMLLDNNIEELVEVVCAEKIKIVTTGAGTPKPYLNQLLKHNVQVFPVVPNLLIAKKMLNLEISGIIPEGLEAGGHIGTETTLTLLPQVTAISHIPVLAAGGIYDFDSFKAAILLGASGVQVGTAFLVAKECEINPVYKDLICKSQNPGTLTIKNTAGIFERILKNPGLTSKNISLKRAVLDGNLREGAFMAGQVSDRIKKVEPAEQIIKRILGLE